MNIIVKRIVSGAPEYDFITPDKVGHTLWLVTEEKDLRDIENIFKNEVPHTYVADGHHRTAAAARVGAERRKSNPKHKGDEEYNFFLAVHFPASQLTIFDYNRVIRDLNGLKPDEFLNKVSHTFAVKKAGNKPVRPSKVHEFTMYLEGLWYILSAAHETYNDNDPIDCLDVTVLSKAILDPILDIKDLRKSDRIDFVGGIRGLEELQRRVDSGEMAVAFALFPVSMDQLMRIADTGNIMPPKTTWFEPKLRSGLVIHNLE